jgi:hypothetical protein
MLHEDYAAPVVFLLPLLPSSLERLINGARSRHRRRQPDSLTNSSRWLLWPRVASWTLATGHTVRILALGMTARELTE